MKVPRSLAQVVSVAALGLCPHAQTSQPPASPRWIANDQDRNEAIENYRRYLASGGPYSQRLDALARLDWRQ